MSVALNGIVFSSIVLRDMERIGISSLKSPSGEMPIWAQQYPTIDIQLNFI